MERKFKEALDKLGVTYNEDSGWLSECIISFGGSQGKESRSVKDVNI